jgi:hypothetical protein
VTMAVPESSCDFQGAPVFAVSAGRGPRPHGLGCPSQVAEDRPVCDIVFVIFWPRVTKVHIAKCVGSHSHTPTSVGDGALLRINSNSRQHTQVAEPAKRHWQLGTEGRPGDQQTQAGRLGQVRATRRPP